MRVDSKRNMSEGKDLFTAEWFPYYFERFESSDKVAMMTLAEEGAYHRAIRLAWKYGAVPSDPKVLAAKLQKGCTAKIASVVLSTFEPHPAERGKMIHPILEKIRFEQAEKSQKRRSAGRSGAEARWSASNSDAKQGSEPEKPPKKIANGWQSHSNAIATAKQSHSNRNGRYRFKTSDQDLNRLILACVHASEFAGFDPSVIELGVLYTILQRTDDQPIRSLKYFRPEVEAMAKETKILSKEAIRVMLQRRREQVEASPRELEFIFSGPLFSVPLTEERCDVAAATEH